MLLSVWICLPIAMQIRNRNSDSDSHSLLTFGFWFPCCFHICVMIRIWLRICLPVHAEIRNATKVPNWLLFLLVIRFSIRNPVCSAFIRSYSDFGSYFGSDTPLDSHLLPDFLPQSPLDLHSDSDAASGCRSDSFSDVDSVSLLGPDSLSDCDIFGFGSAFAFIVGVRICIWLRVRIPVLIRV